MKSHDVKQNFTTDVKVVPQLSDDAEIIAVSLFMLI